MTSKQMPVLQHLPAASRLVYGCMGLGGEWNRNSVSDEDYHLARTMIDCALEAGINYFDHADIYSLSKAETVFGQALRDTPSLREQMILQSKCAIRFEDDMGPGRYDFSASWVAGSVDGILRRLNTEKLDVLLLHRPDPLMELDELAETLTKIKQAGKVDFFGVSNMNLHQIRFLQSALDMPVVINQIEMSLAKRDWLDAGVLVGSDGGNQVDFDSGTLEYCQMEKIQLQSWGSLANGRFFEQGLRADDPDIRQTSQLIVRLSHKYQVPEAAIVLAFLLRHPAGIQPVFGTTRPERVKACAAALTVTLSREDWYQLYVTARGHRLP